MVSTLSNLKSSQGLFRRLSLAGLASLFALTGLPTLSQASTLVGNVIHGQYEFPSIGEEYPASNVSPDPFTVGDGVDAEFLIEGVTRLSIDFSASSLLITLNTTLTDPTWTPTGQNGPVFSVESGNAFPTITSVLVNGLGSPGLPCALPGMVVCSFLASDKLYINFAGWSYKDGDTVRVDFATSPVPLPAALPLFAAGLGAMGIMGWRKKRKALTA